MSFWAQLVGTAALFSLVEGVEAAMRRLMPGFGHAVYWAVKTAVGLPLAIWVIWELRVRGYTLDIAPVLAGVCLPAALFLWLYGDDGDGRGDGNG